MKSLLLGLLLLLLQSAAHGMDQRARDAEFAALIASIPMGSSNRGMHEKEQLLADRFHAHGPAAIPYLLPLLESNEEHLRNFAGYVLRDQTGLTARHLPALIKGYQRGSDWLPPAIGRIGTPAAIEFLIADLKARPQSNTQITYALELAGEPAVPLPGSAAGYTGYSKRRPGRGAVPDILWIEERACSGTAVQYSERQDGRADKSAVCS